MIPRRAIENIRSGFLAALSPRICVREKLPKPAIRDRLAGGAD